MTTEMWIDCMELLVWRRVMYSGILWGKAGEGLYGTYTSITSQEKTTASISSVSAPKLHVLCSSDTVIIKKGESVCVRG